MRRALVFLLALCLWPLGGGAGATHPAAHAPTVYAHRGGAGYAPENTLGAFRKTWSLYGDRGVWLELDTLLTKDGAPVVLHDDTLDRTTDCTGPLLARTYLELAPCNAAESYPGWTTFEPIPLLEDVLNEGKAAGWPLMVEIKQVPGAPSFDAAAIKTTDAVLAVVVKTGFPFERLRIQSFWPPVLDRIELTMPQIDTVLLTHSTLPGAPKDVGFYLTENAAFSAARGYEVSAPNVETPDFSAASVAAAHALQREVVPYTIDDAAVIATAASYGVDGVITNRPDTAFAVLTS